MATTYYDMHRYDIFFSGFFLGCQRECKCTSVHERASVPVRASGTCCLFFAVVKSRCTSDAGGQMSRFETSAP